MHSEQSNKQTNRRNFFKKALPIGIASIAGGTLVEFSKRSTAHADVSSSINVHGTAVQPQYPEKAYVERTGQYAKITRVYSTQFDTWNQMFTFAIPVAYDGTYGTQHLKAIYLYFSTKTQGDSGIGAGYNTGAVKGLYLFDGLNEFAIINTNNLSGTYLDNNSRRSWPLNHPVTESLGVHINYQYDTSVDPTHPEAYPFYIGAIIASFG